MKYIFGVLALWALPIGAQAEPGMTRAQVFTDQELLAWQSHADLLSALPLFSETSAGHQKSAARLLQHMIAQAQGRIQAIHLFDRAGHALWQHGETAPMPAHINLCPGGEPQAPPWHFEILEAQGSGTTAVLAVAMTLNNPETGEFMGKLVVELNPEALR